MILVRPSASNSSNVYATRPTGETWHLTPDQQLPMVKPTLPPPTEPITPSIPPPSSLPPVDSGSNEQRKEAEDPAAESDNGWIVWVVGGAVIFLLGGAVLIRRAKR